MSSVECERWNCWDGSGQRGTFVGSCVVTMSTWESKALKMKKKKTTWKQNSTIYPSTTRWLQMHLVWPTNIKRRGLKIGDWGLGIGFGTPQRSFRLYPILELFLLAYESKSKRISYICIYLLTKKKEKRKSKTTYHLLPFMPFMLKTQKLVNNGWCKV